MTPRKAFILGALSKTIATIVSYKPPVRLDEFCLLTEHAFARSPSHTSLQRSACKRSSSLRRKKRKQAQLKVIQLTRQRDQQVQLTFSSPSTNKKASEDGIRWVLALASILVGIVTLMTLSISGHASTHLQGCPRAGSLVRHQRCTRRGNYCSPFTRC